MLPSCANLHSLFEIAQPETIASLVPAWRRSSRPLTTALLKESS